MILQTQVLYSFFSPTSYTDYCNTTKITLWIQDCIQISDATISFLKNEKDTISSLLSW